MEHAVGCPFNQNMLAPSFPCTSYLVVPYTLYLVVPYTLLRFVPYTSLGFVPYTLLYLVTCTLLGFVPSWVKSTKSIKTRVHFREFDRIVQTNLANYLAYYFADNCGKILHINSENYWRMTDLRGEKKSLSKQNFTANCVV